MQPSQFAALIRSKCNTISETFLDYRTIYWFFILQRVPFNWETCRSVWLSVGTAATQVKQRNYDLIRSINQHSHLNLWVIIMTIISLLFKESIHVLQRSLKKGSASGLSSPERVMSRNTVYEIVGQSRYSYDLSSSFNSIELTICLIPLTYLRASYWFVCPTESIIYSGNSRLKFTLESEQNS